MMSKPVYLSVEIVTDNPTSGKISISQLVSVAEQNGLSLTWSQPQYLCQHACVYQLCMLTDVIYRLLIISTSIKNIFHVSDRVWVHVYVIISSSLKPYKISGLIWVQTVQWCYHLWWFVIKETDNFKTDHRYSIRSHPSWQWPWRVKIYITYEKLLNSKYITALSAVCRNIVFNNERIIWGKHFTSYQDLFTNLYKMYQLFGIGNCLEILFSHWLEDKAIQI